MPPVPGLGLLGLGLLGLGLGPAGLVLGAAGEGEVGGSGDGDGSSGGGSGDGEGDDGGVEGVLVTVVLVVLPLDVPLAAAEDDEFVVVLVGSGLAEALTELLVTRSGLGEVVLEGLGGGSVVLDAYVAFSATVALPRLSVVVLAEASVPLPAGAVTLLEGSVALAVVELSAGDVVLLVGPATVPLEAGSEELTPGDVSLPVVAVSLVEACVELSGSVFGSGEGLGLVVVPLLASVSFPAVLLVVLL